MVKQAILNPIVGKFLGRSLWSGPTYLTGPTLAEISEFIGKHAHNTQAANNFFGVSATCRMTLAVIKAAIDESKTTVDAVKNDFPEMIELLGKVKIPHPEKTVNNAVYTVASGTFDWLRGNENSLSFSKQI